MPSSTQLLSKSTRWNRRLLARTTRDSLHQVSKGTTNCECNSVNHSTQKSIQSSQATGPSADDVTLIKPATSSVLWRDRLGSEMTQVCYWLAGVKIISTCTFTLLLWLQNHIPEFRVTWDVIVYVCDISISYESMKGEKLGIDFGSSLQKIWDAFLWWIDPRQEHACRIGTS